MSPPDQKSSINRWQSPRWPKWPLALKINACKGADVLLHSVEIAIGGPLAPSALKAVSSSGCVLGLIEYSPGTRRSQKTVFFCDPPIIITHLELILEAPIPSPLNYYDQVALKHVILNYSICVHDVIPLNVATSSDENDELSDIENLTNVTMPTECFGASYAILEGIVTNYIKRLRLRHRRCEQRHLDEECSRLNESMEILSAMLSEARALDQERLALIHSGKEPMEDAIEEQIQELLCLAEKEIEEIETFNPCSLLSQEEQTDCARSKVASGVKELETSSDPFKDMEKTDSRTTESPIDRDRTARPFYELFGRTAVDSVFFSRSDSERLHALNRCFSIMRTNLSSYKPASEKLVTIVRYDPSFKVRELCLVIAELVSGPEVLTETALHFACDACKLMRTAAIRVLSHLWSQSEARRALLVTQIACDLPVDDWRSNLGRCLVIYRLITLFNCSVQPSGSRVGLSTVMPFIARVLQNPHQAVRNAAVAICNEIEHMLGPEPIEPYLNQINPLSMLPKVDQDLSDNESRNDASKESRPDLAVKELKPEIMHFVPVPKDSEEMLRIWSF